MVLPAFLTTLFFSLSVIFAARSARLLGGATANLGRMIVAVILLGAWAFSFGKGVSGPGFAWFFVSGIIGFGFGDVALFLALPRIGPRLTILLAQCLAAPFAALIERVWLGTALRGPQLAYGTLILVGVAIALAPKGIEKSQPRAMAGAFWGIIAALGQALGAVSSRKGYDLSREAGIWIDGGTAAFQRMLGGIIVAGMFFTVIRLSRRAAPPIGAAPPIAWLWVLLNGLAGPAIGVGCYQWALAGLPSGIVLPIVATSPVVTMPLAWLIDGDKPAPRAIFGGLLAVAGSVLLASVKNS